MWSATGFKTDDNNNLNPVNIYLFKVNNRNTRKRFEICFFFNWYSLHARLNSHYEAWSYKKRKHKKVKAYRKSL